MSAYYDLYETPSPQGKEEKTALHARIYPKKTYTKEEFIERTAMFQHLPKNMLGHRWMLCSTSFATCLPMETLWNLATWAISALR